MWMAACTQNYFGSARRTPPPRLEAARRRVLASVTNSDTDRRVSKPGTLVSKLSSVHVSGDMRRSISRSSPVCEHGRKLSTVALDRAVSRPTNIARRPLDVRCDAVLLYVLYFVSFPLSAKEIGWHGAEEAWGSRVPSRLLASPQLHSTMSMIVCLSWRRFTSSGHEPRGAKGTRAGTGSGCGGATKQGLPRRSPTPFRRAAEMGMGSRREAEQLGPWMADTAQGSE